MVVTSQAAPEGSEAPPVASAATLRAEWRRPLVVWAFVASVTLAVAQLLTIGRIELMSDEAYYTLWSRDLAWGYLDHPPMVAIWIRASTSLFGGAEFGVRALGAIAVALGPALIAWIAWRAFRSIETAALASLMWVAMPLPAAEILMTPDTPLTAFWTLSLAGLVEVWRTRRAAWWLLVGVALGLALLSKFTAAFLGAGIALALFATPSLRRWFGSPAPYVAAFVALAIFAPFVIWNADHHWMTFRFQLSRVPPHGFTPRFLAEFVGTQIGLLNPLVFCALIAAIGATLASRDRLLAPEDEARRLLLATIAPAVAYFAFHALHAQVAVNWLAPLYPAAAILAADAVARARRAATPSRWRALVAAAGRYAPPLGLAMALGLYLQTATRALHLGRADPTARIGDWRALAVKIDDLARQQSASYLLTGGYLGGYEETSLLTYYGDPTLPVVEEDDDHDRWLFRTPPSEALFAQPGLAFGRLGWGFDAALAKRYRHVEEIARVARPDGDMPMRQYAIYRVDGLIAP